MLSHQRSASTWHPFDFDDLQLLFAIYWEPSPSTWRIVSFIVMFGCLQLWILFQHISCVQVFIFDVVHFVFSVGSSLFFWRYVSLQRCVPTGELSVLFIPMVSTLWSQVVITHWLLYPFMMFVPSCTSLSLNFPFLSFRRGGCLGVSRVSRVSKFKKSVYKYSIVSIRFASNLISSCSTDLVLQMFNLPEWSIHQDVFTSE